MNDANEASATPDSGLLCLALMARLLGLPADPEQIRHQFGRSGQRFGAQDMLRAAHRIGMKAKAMHAGWQSLTRLRLPAIAENSAGHYFILGRVDADKALIQDPLEKHRAFCPARNWKTSGPGGSFSSRAKVRRQQRTGVSISPGSFPR